MQSIPMNDTVDSKLDWPDRPRGGPSLLRGESTPVVALTAMPAGARPVGLSSLLSAVMRKVDRVAATESTVLIQGETGTGKELIARAIHDGSCRKGGPFVKLNVAAIPGNLLESELFGHERGAFTGALERRIGRFEQAEGGTIFLDEIGEMAPDLQPKLLRVLQEREFERVGGMRTISSNARLVAATNRDLGALARSGGFRADLYYRLNVFPVDLPPLRDRRGDVPLLAAHFLDEFSKRLNRQGLSFSCASMASLEQHDWPGNIRELQNVVERAVIMATGRVLEVQLDAIGSRPVPPELDLAAFIRERLIPNATDLYSDTHSRVDRLLLTMALDHTRGNHSDAARLLGISRQTMRVKLRALGLQVTHTLLESGGRGLPTQANS